ncbi:MAG: AMP-binding protein [Rikenellaceae bacterium]
MLSQNLIKLYEESFRRNSELPALSDYFKHENFTYLEIAREIAKLHLLFEQAQIKQGDKIALVGRNNPRWCISYLATITYGAVIVPILQDFNGADIIHIINHSESRMVFMGDNFWDMMDGDQIPDIEAVWSLTDFHSIYERDGDTLSSYMSNIETPYFERFGGEMAADQIKYVDLPNSNVTLLNYTSGTTGSSKGVILTINNLTGNVVTALGFINASTNRPFFDDGGRVLSFLPLAHAYGCAFDFLTPLAKGMHVTLLGRIPSPKILIEAMAVVRPTLVCCVPLILEKIYRKQILPMLDQSAMSIVMKIPLLNTAIYSVIKSKLMATFGGEVGVFIVGGAPMNQETESFLLKIGFPIAVGYGMTECAPLISFAPPEKFKPGSCGIVLDDVLEVKIDSSDPQNVPGEIIVRGEHVMNGYYKNDAATKAVLKSDGWLHTGDMGVMDPDGALYIRGRSKTMILSASGQNIYPEQIEDKLNNLYMVGESLIIENKANNRLSALVVPDFDQVEAAGLSDAGLSEIMEQNLAALNKMVASYEQVASITIFPNEFEKTPKKSVKRYLYDTSLLKTKMFE